MVAHGQGRRVGRVGRRGGGRRSGLCRVPPACRRPWSPSPVSHCIGKMYDVSDDGKQMVGILDEDDWGRQMSTPL
jgi:hypothetical protein